MLKKGIINFLSENTIKKITAGELFYSPALIIKELLENSIDAKSKTIDVILINSGKTIIKVLDNGIGMNTYDASICFKRYTTSKIENIEDLFKLKTNGFRGEALSFISSISQIEIITKDKNSYLGTNLFLDKGVIYKYNPIQTNIGTNITVKNIFFNIPIRRNFLKSDNIELYDIINEFNIIALSNFDINFRLINNNKLIFSLLKSSLKERILDIFPKKKSEYLIPIFYKKDDLLINGFISKIPYSINNKYEQYIFVNNKYIYNKDLYKCITSAYKGLLQKNKYPYCFIFLHIKNEYLYINISPNKKNILFKNEKYIYNSIKMSIRNIIFKTLVKVDIINNTLNDKVEKNKYIDKYNNIINIKDYYLLDNKIYKLDYNSIFNKKNIHNNIEKNIEYNYGIQIYKKYIITNYHSKIIIIDQHRAHQRILYDNIKKILEKNTIYSNIILPIKIGTSNIDIEKLKFIIFELNKLGFSLEKYKYYIIIKSIPFFLKNNILIKFFKKLFNNINDIKNNNYEKIILNNISKTMAIKRGQILTNKEINYIIKKLFLCKNFFISPLKKNILLSISIDYLDKKFNL